jgi:hypothetical protein
MTGTEVDVVTGEIVPAVTYRARDTFGILRDAVALADVICNTEMVPQVLRDRPDAIVAVVLAGHELGLGPMQSLQTIDLIQGRPALSPEGMRALVLARGHGFDVDATDEYCTVLCRRREWPADREWRAFTFTLADAERAHLLGKDNWARYPEAMLTARATGKACRALFADVIAGLGYTPDEVDVPAANAPPRSTPPPAGASQAPEAICAIDGAEEVVAEILAEPDAVRAAFRDWRKSKRYPQEGPTSPEMVAEWRTELAKIKAQQARDAEPYEPRREVSDSVPIGSALD